MPQLRGNETILGLNTVTTTITSIVIVTATVTFIAIATSTCNLSTYHYIQYVTVSNLSLSLYHQPIANHQHVLYQNLYT
jgi:hypothetical protein